MIFVEEGVGYILSVQALQRYLKDLAAGQRPSMRDYGIPVSYYGGDLTGLTGEQASGLVRTLLTFLEGGQPLLPPEFSEREMQLLLALENKASDEEPFDAVAA